MLIQKANDNRLIDSPITRSTPEPVQIIPEEWEIALGELFSEIQEELVKQIIESRPAFIEITGEMKRWPSSFGSIHVTWLSRGAEINIEVLADGEVWVFVGNVERHHRWQVEDYTDIWVHIASHLKEYQRW